MAQHMQNSPAKSAPFTIPAEAVRYILYQRTSNLKFRGTKLYRLLQRYTRLDPFRPMVAFESRFRKAGITDNFQQQMQLEYERIAGFLPKAEKQSPIRLLDIGCGVAGLDLLLNRHYQGLCDIHLLDKSQLSDSIYYGFEQSAAFYNSLALAENMLLQNGVAAERLHCHEAPEAGDEMARAKLVQTLGPAQIDLVISTISWGFHYPVSTYLSEVLRLLSPEGRVIMDLRLDSEERQALMGAFERCEPVYSNDKFERLCLSGPKR